MAAQDESRRDVDSELLPELAILAGLVFAFGLFLYIAICSSPGSTDRPASIENPVTTISSRGPISAALVPELPRTLEATQSPDHSQGSTAPPHAVPVLAALNPEKEIPTRFLPAVAEKPPLSVLAKDGSESHAMDRQPLSEAELTSSLRQVAIPVGLDETQAVFALEKVRLAERNHKRPRGPEDAVLALLDENIASSFPFAKGSECELEHSKAEALDTYSRMLTRQIALAEGSQGRHPRSSRLSDRGQPLALALRNGRKWQAEKAIPAMLQILQVEALPVRLQLVEMLSEFGTPEATEALLNRAVFDLSPDVRLSANAALDRLYHSEYRQELVDALRYPWPEVAWNAAETLAALKDTSAVPELIDLLDAPDPRLPFPDESGRMVLRELVGINHVQNCLLCHAPSRGTTDKVRRVVPTASSSSQGSRYGSGSSGGIRVNDVLVRADVTYLRQDFSVMQNMGAFNGGDPKRIDYLVTTREATREEITQAENHPAEDPPRYPQRDAVLFALRKLTGQNPGTQSEDWRRLEF